MGTCRMGRATGLGGGQPRLAGDDAGAFSGGAGGGIFVRCAGREAVALVVGGDASAVGGGVDAAYYTACAKSGWRK